jgi:hypothetical protein
MKHWIASALLLCRLIAPACADYTTAPQDVVFTAKLDGSQQCYPTFRTSGS